MKYTFFLLFALTLLVSCTPTIQVVTLRGSNVHPAEEGLVLDNDTLTLQYSFASERGEMKLSVVNKLNKPLYIDWKQSSFIIGQTKFDYWHDVADVNVSTSGYIYRYGHSNISSVNLSTGGSITKENPVSFIPPHTKATKRQFIVLPNGTVPTLGTPAISQEQARWATKSKKTVTIHTYTYPSEHSPLRFRNYLTLSTDRDFKTEFYIDTQFWASNVRVEPEAQAVDVLQKQPDGAYVQAKSFGQKDSFYVILSGKR